MRCRGETVIQAERGGSGMKRTDVEKLFHASFSSSRYPLNVADCARDKSESIDFHPGLETDAEANKD